MLISLSCLCLVYIVLLSLCDSLSMVCASFSVVIFFPLRMHTCMDWKWDERLGRKSFFFCPGFASLRFSCLTTKPFNSVHNSWASWVWAVEGFRYFTLVRALVKYLTTFHSDLYKYKIIFQIEELGLQAKNSFLKEEVFFPDPSYTSLGVCWHSSLDKCGGVTFLQVVNRKLDIVGRTNKALTVISLQTRNFDFLHVKMKSPQACSYKAAPRFRTSTSYTTSIILVAWALIVVQSNYLHKKVRTTTYAWTEKCVFVSK